MSEKTNKDYLNLEVLESERQRKEDEIMKKLEDKKLVENKVSSYSELRKKPYIASKYKDRKRVLVEYKESLDMTSQSDRDLYSIESLYNRYVMGDPLPMGAIKDGLQYTGEDISYNYDDLTDLHIKNNEFKELNKTLPDNDDDEQNDDDEKEELEKTNKVTKTVTETQ